MAKKKTSFNLIQFIGGIILCTLLGVFTITLNSTCNSLNVEIGRLNRELSHSRNEFTNIQNKITDLSRGDRIQEFASEKMNMVPSVLEPIDIVIND
jgi:cell division protein FtsL